MRRTVGYLLICLSSTWSISVQAEPKRPAIVIPGILGSKLCEKDSGRVAWGNRDSLVNFAKLEVPAGAEQVELPHTSCGIIDSIQILGPWRMHQYDDLLATLNQLGYVEGTNLFVFDYDWRLSNLVSVERLVAKIEEWVGADEVDVIAHSMGGIVARLYLDYLDQDGNAGRVKHLITLGTPYRGSADAFRTLDEGWGFWRNLAARGLDVIRTTAMTFPSTYELLPNYPKRNCCAWRMGAGSDLQYFEPLDPDMWARFGFLPDSYDRAPRNDWLADTLGRAAQVHAVMAKPFPVGVKRVAVATGLIVDTPFKVIFDSASGEVVSYENWPGDGTVIDFSAADWNVDQARASTTEHQRIFADDAVRQVLNWLLSDREPTRGELKNFVRKLKISDQQEVEVTGVAFEIDPPSWGRARSECSCLTSPARTH